MKFRFEKTSGENSVLVKVLKRINSFVFKVISELINQTYYESKYPKNLNNI